MNIPKMNDNFLSLIEDNKGIIYKIAYSYSQNAEGRKDLVQEVIVQLWISFSKYDEQRKWSTWMYRIALNVAISFFRKESKRKAIASPLDENIIDTVAENENIEKDINIKRLYKFIEQLNKLDRALMILYLESKSYTEIAEILGITETNVATKISRIKTKLKQKISTIKAD